MLNERFILRSFVLFFNHQPLKLIVLFMITVFQALCQGVSLVMLIPLLTLLDSSIIKGPDNQWTAFFNGIADSLGLTINITTILIFFLSILFFTAILTYYQTILQSTYQQHFSHEIRQSLYRKIIYSDWRFLNGKSKHNHIQILTSEIPKMTNYYYFYLSLATKVLFILAHIIIAMFISFYFTAFVVIIGALIALFLRKYFRKAEMIGGSNIAIFRTMLKRIDDFWATVKMAKVHHSERFYMDKFDESSQQMLEYQNKQVCNKAASTLWYMLLGITSLVGMVYVAYGYLHLPFALLFLLILLFSRIFSQFVSINNDLNMLYSNVSSVRLVLDLNRQLEEVKPDSGGADLSQTIDLESEIKISNLSFGYIKPLFEDLNACIPAHCLTGILGASGTGKTTLIDLLAGLQKPLSGVIYIDGKTLTENQWSEWRKCIGYLPQDSFFVDGTIRENLLWDSMFHFSDREIEEVLKRVNIYDLIIKQRDGLDTFIANYQFYFSGGERQRLALARALLRKPQLLLLDEATSSLDAENEKIIIDCLLQLRKQITIVFVTHHRYLIDYFDYTISFNETNINDTCVNGKK